MSDKTLLNRVEFTWNCTESKWVALSVTPSAPRAKRRWTFGITGKNLGRSNLTHVEVTAISSAKASVTMSLTVGIRVFTCVCLHICVFVFPLRAISEGQIVSNFSSQIWASEFDTKCALCFFVFVKKKKKKSSFVAKCTCEDFALKWLSCRSGAVEERSRERRFEVCRNLLGVLQ